MRFVVRVILAGVALVFGACAVSVGPGDLARDGNALVVIDAATVRRCATTRLDTNRPAGSVCDAETAAFCARTVTDWVRRADGRAPLTACDPHDPVNRPCEPADRCGPDGCRCGDASACTWDEVCVRGRVDDPTAGPHCECIVEARR